MRNQQRLTQGDDMSAHTMDIDQPSSAEAAEQQQPAANLQLLLAVLNTIKPAQSQNGLKHGDYGRYRQYCAHRLRSLYKALKFLHGKGRYTKKKLDVPQVTDARHLHIALVSAERAWAHAMQLKQDASNSTSTSNDADGLAVDKRKRHHALRRLTKAAYWAGELSRLAHATCDTRSALEADAYSSWMTGNVWMEKETDWKRALAAYTRANQLFGELAKVGDPESQALCAAMVEELGPSLRYCNYQISRAGGAPPDPAALAALAEEGGGDAGGLLQSKLATLAAEAQTTQATSSSSSSSFEWRGLKARVAHERVRVALHAAAEAAAALQHATAAANGNTEPDGSASIEQLLPQHDRIINLYTEARAAAKAAIKTAQAGGAASSNTGQGAVADAVDLDELTALDKALSGAILEASLSRGEAAAGDAAQRFNAALARQAGGKAGKGSGSRSKERPAKPEDLVRLYSNLTQLASELEELADHLGGRAGEALAAAAAAREAGYAAWRSYYMGHAALVAAAATAVAAVSGGSGGAGSRWREAAGLFKRAGERAADAARKIKDLPSDESAARAALPNLDHLSSSAAAYRLVAAAEAAAEGAAGTEAASKGLQGLGLARAAATQVSQAYLVDSLDTWESFAGTAGGKGARLVSGPYSLTAIPPRPIMVDSAADEIAYPDVTHRFKKRKTAAPQSTFARLFGGWGS